MSADLEELGGSRLKAAGPSVFKRPRSRYRRIKHQVEGKRRYESAATENRRAAEGVLAFQVYQASAGLPPAAAHSSGLSKTSFAMLGFAPRGRAPWRGSSADGMTGFVCDWRWKRKAGR